ncbi:cytidine deaminase [Desulfovibrio sp. OttesenSCG-928-G15]|nr:cytidine deaminase [Desulfovibrio sp. OttesenSCG-928-G15]
MMDEARLMREAGKARENAYAPYSGFTVGAALAANDGRVFHGCNVENASYGLSCCAERAAFYTALAAGCKVGEFAALAVVGECEKPLTPCGACRQVILELGGADLPVYAGNTRGEIHKFTAADLLPEAFSL